MIIEVRTRTVGYNARVKNSLSFSTLPTKPFPRLKGADRAPARGADCPGAGPQPGKPRSGPRDASVVVRFHLQRLLWVSLVQQ